MARKNVYISERMVARVKELSEKYGISESRIIEVAFWMAIEGCRRQNLEEYLRAHSEKYKVEAQAQSIDEREKILRRIFLDYDDPRVQNKYWVPA